MRSNATRLRVRVDPASSGPRTIRPSSTAHPVLIDAGLQLCSLAAATRADKVLPGGSTASVWRGSSGDLSRSVPVSAGLGVARADVTGPPWSQMSGSRRQMANRPADRRYAVCPGRTQTVPAMAERQALYDVAWQRASASPVGTPSKAEGTWLLFADQGGSADALAGRDHGRGRKLRSRRGRQ